MDQGSTGHPPEEPGKDLPKYLRNVEVGAWDGLQKVHVVTAVVMELVVAGGIELPVVEAISLVSPNWILRPLKLASCMRNFSALCWPKDLVPNAFLGRAEVEKVNGHP